MKIKPVSTAEIEALKNNELYPAEILSGAFGYTTNKAVHRYYDEGYLTGADCVDTNPGKRVVGQKRGLRIRGREIKRIALRDGFKKKGLAA